MIYQNFIKYYQVYLVIDLSNQLQDRLDNILLLMKQNNQPFNGKPIEQIPNDPLSN